MVLGDIRMIRGWQIAGLGVLLSKAWILLALEAFMPVRTTRTIIRVIVTIGMITWVILRLNMSLGHSCWRRDI